MAIAVALFLAFCIFVSGAWEAMRRRTLPPGPTPLPILGNLLQLSTRPWINFARWGKIYGPVTSATIFGRVFIIVNDHKVATEILDQGSSSSSSRPLIAMASMSGWGGLLPMVPAGKRLKQTRTYLHKGLNANALEKYLPVIQRNAAIFVRRVLERPDNVLPELRRAVNVGIGRITYGLELSPVNAPFVELAEKGLQSFEQSTRPGSWPVDLFTGLRHLPSWFPAPFIRRAREWRTGVVHRITTEPFMQALDEITQGKGETSVISEITEDLHDLKSNEELMDIIKWTATSSYLGGSDTSISTLSTFVLAMILNPDIQRKAQAEVDSVVGSERLPEFSDRPSLPYVECILKEIFRWKPSVPMIFPHLVDKDITYNGWTIPKGSTIVANAWGMLQDGDTYENPDEFRPERHMEGKVLDPTGPTFGYGRRVCPGMAVAQRSLWMIIVTALATVEFGCHVASDGTKVKPEVRYNNLPVQQPLPFPSAVRPRSEAKVELIERALWFASRYIV